MSSKKSVHAFDERGLETTKNLRGFMHELNDISQAFIGFAPQAPGQVVDIGAAYGVATIPIINQTIKVVACDLEASHLEILSHRIKPSLRHYLVKKVGQFPSDIDFDQNSVGAILLSHILPFLSPNELDVAFQKLAYWIAPKGKVFIACYSPYMGCFKRFIPIYEERLSSGVRWPCWVENNVHDYLEAPQDVVDNLPSTMNYLDCQVLVRVLESSGFIIERAEYLEPDINNIPAGVRLDGREWAGVIGIKKV